MLADPFGDFAKKLGVLVNKDAKGLGMRSNRYTMIIENKTINNAFTGSLIGAGEIILLPFDIFKIRMQTNPSLMKGKNKIEVKE